MRQPTVEQGMAVGALCLFAMLCAGLLAWSFQARLDALQELSQRQDQLERLQAAARAKGGPHGEARIAAAPAAAFLDAPTAGLAGASLQAHVARLAGHHATLVSFAIQPPGGSDPAETVRIEASMDISLRALQLLLYALESGTPYVFVETMTVAAAAATAQPHAPDAPLRVTLGLRSLWRRTPSASGG